MYQVFISAIFIGGLFMLPPTGGASVKGSTLYLCLRGRIFDARQDLEIMRYNKTTWWKEKLCLKSCSLVDPDHRAIPGFCCLSD